MLGIQLASLERSDVGEFNLNVDTITDEASTKIAYALQVRKHFTNMDLECLTISDLGIKQIADALKTNTTLTSLRLSIDHIRDKAAIAIADALKANKTITSLTLGCKVIDYWLARRIAYALQVNTTITFLDLRMPYSIKTIFRCLAENNSITHLQLPDFVVTSHSARIIANDLKANKTLYHLNLNIRDVEAAQTLDSALTLDSSRITIAIYPHMSNATKTILKQY